MLKLEARAGGEGPTAPPSVQQLARTSRASLGLTKTIIATGHQPGFWHGGILAKHSLAQALADAHVQRGTDAEAVHVVADHDANDGSLIEFPQEDDSGHWSVHRERLLPADAGVAWHDREWLGVRTPGREPSSLPWASGRAARLSEFVRGASGTPAQRLVRANLWAIASAAETESIGNTSLASTTAMLGTPLGRHIVQTAVDDPARCAAAWNVAVSTAPRTAGALRSDRGELPFWVAGPGVPRERATVDSARAWLEGRADQHLLPTAFIATGLARLLVDRWIHGVGGSHYERVADRFWHEWLGWTPPPFTVATADVLLPIGKSGAITPGDVQPGARRRSIQHLRRNPDMLIGESATQSRRTAADAIKALPRRSALRRQAYGALREGVGRDAALASESLAHLEAVERERARDANDRTITTARTWGAWLLPGTLIRELHEAARREAAALAVSPSA